VTDGLGGGGVALDAAARGDAHALAGIWRAHQPLLLRYLRGRGLDDPEGLTTQIWIDAARNLPAFRGDGDDFRAWLFTIAHRRVVDARRQAARQVAAASLDELQETASSATTPGADDAYDDRVAGQRALDLVAALPDSMREAVLLRVVADLSVAETAAVMGVSAANVRVLVHRGLRRLEQQLTGEPAGKLAVAV
jgi:RNA polymerase sigma-70 factor (ECF subfamily)